MICPYCRDRLDLDPPGAPPPEEGEEPRRRLMVCTDCDTRVHTACAQLHGACVTHGCGGTRFAFTTQAPEPRRVVAPRVERTHDARPPAPRRRRRTRPEPPPRPEPQPGWVPAEDLPLFALALCGIAGVLLLG